MCYQVCLCARCTCARKMAKKQQKEDEEQKSAAAAKVQAAARGTQARKRSRGLRQISSLFQRTFEERIVRPLQQVAYEYFGEGKAEVKAPAPAPPKPLKRELSVSYSSTQLSYPKDQ